ncbi:C6 transcription factor [Aspergillus sclerotioniger CBS 115572]|uniref:C6 transcription factor n=1 Tax=Aspergillus sclerotioniger CBS 115572 TaxID=1450535 RepID=A0A317WBX1_9EURO|nr:C6 transcription factor [Aspergillus sclerotioniger CBS 115572]PWY81630.1 C6 transcription factor [Aspergillus sclerotioniger CBS 115572]
MTSERKQRLLAPAASKDPVPPPLSSLPPQRKVSTACSNCRARKARCSGTAPCDWCASRDLPCSIDEATDSRRKINIKRKIDSLEGDRDVLTRILDSLRSSGLTRTRSLLQLIRSNASLEELQLFVDDQLQIANTLGSTVEDDEVQMSDESIFKIPRRVLNPKRLADQPVFRVPAKPWTRVTDDDDFVSHLISLYFTWRHACFPCIDRDLFIRDMKAAKLKSQFCSPFLVNAILADACAYSDYAEAYEVPSDLSTRGTHFYYEAKRCFEQEDGHTTIATVQGLAVLSTCACFMGKDRRGWIYQGQLAFAAKELERTLPSISYSSLTEKSEIERAMGVTLWGLYTTTIAQAFAYQRPPLIEKPSCPCPPSTHNDNDPLWHHYPHGGDGLQGHFMCYFNSLSELTTIVDVWCTLLFDGFTKPSRDEVHNMEGKVRTLLVEWERTLQPCLRIESGRVMLPHVLSAYGCESQWSSPDRHPEEVALSSARQIAGLMEVHRTLWGIDIFPASHIQWITVSMFTLLGGLDVPVNQEAFTTLAVAAKVASRRWPIAKGTLRAIQVTARKMGVDLPAETAALFIDFEKEIWEPKGGKGISSLYPNFAVLAGSLPDDEVELDKFLEKQDVLNTSDRDGE